MIPDIPDDRASTHLLWAGKLWSPITEQKRQRIDAETILSALRIIAAFNQLDLAAVDIYQGGKKLDIDPKTIDRFMITGLSNKCFIEMGFHDGSGSLADIPEEWVNG